MATTKTPSSERDRRYARIREGMRASGLDALLVGCKGHWWTGRGYARYLSDFHLWGHDGLILLPAEGEPALAVTSYAVANLVARRGWITDTGGDVFLAPRILKAIRERGLERARIGTVGTPWIISADLHRTLADELAHAQLEPADEIVDRARMVKSAIEIQQNHEVWELAKTSMERFAAVLRPGATGLELAAEASKVALAGGARDVLVLLGDRSDRYGPPDDEPLRCDDVVRYHMEISGPSGHWCELTLTFAFRPLAEDEARLLDSELRAYEAVRAAARPGVRLAELANTFEETVVGDGWELGAATQHFDFHGQGMDVIELPWYAAEQPWGSTGDAELEPGTIVSYHPRRNVVPAVGWSPGVSDNLLVTDDGAEWLSGEWSHTWREVTP
jgi:Xaa-Pro aminopeptidase